MSDITELIAAYRRGEITLDEVARRLRERAWPPPTRPFPRTPDEAYRRELEDPEPLQDGTFDEVYRARDRGELTRDEYDTLAAAAAEAIAEQRPRES